MQKRERRRFTAEFKAKAVQLAWSSEKSLSEIARDLGLVPSVLTT